MFERLAIGGMPGKGSAAATRPATATAVEEGDAGEDGDVEVDALRGSCTATAADDR